MEWMLMPLKRYADFTGRSRRKEYWMFALFQLIVALVPMFLIISISDLTAGVPALLWVFLLVYLAVFLIPTIAVTVRRFHDQDKSGWFYLLSFIPYVGGIAVFVFMCLEGTSGANRFGDDAKGRGAQDVFG